MFEWAWHRLGRRNFQNQDPQLRASLSSQDPGGVRFVISETARVLRFEHRISEIYRTLKESADVEIRKERNFVMFFRPEPLTRKRMPLKMWQAHFIKLMQKNVNMAVAISNISSHTQVDPKMLGDFIDGLIESSVIVKVR
jgi:hypothetical protein